jgi:peptide/nickel transport system ATP-binding protein
MSPNDGMALPAVAPAVAVHALRKHFRLKPVRLFGPARVVHAVSDVSFELPAGQTLGIVGESGCGKSTLARLLMGLLSADAGEVTIAGARLDTAHAEGLKALRRNMQMVFQDSFASLNPRMTVESSIMFGPLVHGVGRDAARATAHRLLERVGLAPAQFAGRYPHALSGGQRQRVNIARALALQPKVVVFDEAVSALDKSVEIQVLNLLDDLRQEFALTYLFISHDLHVVQYISDQVMVMYLGKVVEMGPAAEVCGSPRHPYTRALLASMPSMDPARRTLQPPVMGDPPSPIDPPSGCRYRTRCPHAEAVCAAAEPALRADRAAVSSAEPRHLAACHMLRADAGHSQSGIAAGGAT